MKRYFFDTDNDGQWYMLPYDKRGEWSQWLNDIGNEFDKYDEYKINTDINKWSFQNPDEILPEEPVNEKLKNFYVFLNKKTKYEKRNKMG